MWPRHPSVEFLIRNFSKARVLVAAPANPVAKQLGIQREITDADAVSAMVKKYAK